MIYRLILIVLSIIHLDNAYANKNGSRIKDLMTIKGVRSNPLIGYGIVTGLNGTGDSKGEITNTTIKQLLKKMGLNLKQEINSQNLAAVIVTAELPPFSKQGSKLNVKVSSIGNAKSLAGGNLIITPIKGGDGKIYAIASGAISIGGLDQGSKFPTVGLIPNGATVEKELATTFDKKKNLRLNLKNPDFTTAARIEKTINDGLGGLYARAKDSTTVDLIIPPTYENRVVQLMAIVENFRVTHDTRAKVVINERTGTIVAGGEIVLKPVAISHGDLTIEIGGNAKQDNKKGKPSVYYMKNSASLKDFVNSLNSFGVQPDDIISIFQALEKNGSLVGEIELI